MKQDKLKIISAKDLGKLNLPDFCPRCFWIERHLDKPPAVFPGIFSTIDAVTKRSTHRSFADRNIPPGWLPATDAVKVEEGNLYFKIEVEPGSWVLVGKPDDIFRSGDGSYHIVDYKTAKITRNQDELFPLYETQLNCYAFLAQRYGLEPVTRLSLIYCEPNEELDCDEDFKLSFKTCSVDVALNLEGIFTLLINARKILDQPKPPFARDNCKGLCQWVDKVILKASSACFQPEQALDKPQGLNPPETSVKTAADTRKAPSIQKAENLIPEPKMAEVAQVYQCPHCLSKRVVRRGLRTKKYETQQRYLCNDCQKSFVSPKAKGKSFPLQIIFEGLCLYNTGFTLEESCRRLKEKSGLEVKASSLADWVKEFEPLCRYSRLRPYGMKLYNPNQIIQSVHLFHRQVYDFLVHRAKLALVLQEYKHTKFDNLREFLEAIQSECPHQFFKEGARGSELKVNFDMKEVIIKGKQNFATRLAGLALQAVNDKKQRHSVLQRFMLCNDSVTVAVEVPVYMDTQDLEHLQNELKFKLPFKLEKTLTGHIDILQIRNGAVHILDYKPGASAGKKKEAITQLTLYALALSRLTGLRLYDFKCAWFDQDNYFEFFPLHVVYKLKKRAQKDDSAQIKMFEK